MDYEIEAKFLNVDLEKLRAKLKTLGAKLEHPTRVMRRALFDHPDHRFQKHNQSRRLRVRDEGDKIAVNFKSKNETNYAHEIEVTVGSFDDMVKLLESIDLVAYSFQESKRETWKYKDVEIVLDEWPWLKPYIEIEGKSEAAIKEVAEELGFDWSDARFGSVETAYRVEYPGLKESESIGDIGTVRFKDPVPEFLVKRRDKK